MFDTIELRCTACGQLIDMQSKAGECLLHCYPYYAVPCEIAKDLNGQTAQCENCGMLFTVRSPASESKIPVYLENTDDR